MQAHWKGGAFGFILFLGVHASAFAQEVGAQDSDALRFPATHADLNDDGIKELIVYIDDSYYCGSGGCSLYILEPEKAAYRVVSEIAITHLPIRALESKSKGWHDLAVTVGGGGILPWYEARIPFGKDGYTENPTIPPAQKINRETSGTVLIDKDSARIELPASILPLIFPGPGQQFIRP